MRIVFPDGAGCVQHPSDLDPLRALGPVDFYDGPPPDRATLIERLRPAEAVVLDYSEMDAEVLRGCPRLPYLSENTVPQDPWGNPYLYVFPGAHGKAYDLYTLGADGQPGGDGVNADIGNWNLGD